MPNLINAVPRPIREILSGVRTIKNGPVDEKFIKITSRTALAALFALLLYSTNTSIMSAHEFGVLISLPSTFIVAGAYASYWGVSMAVDTLSTGSFLSLTMSLGFLASGWTILEYHDYRYLDTIGIADAMVILPTAKKYAK